MVLKESMANKKTLKEQRGKMEHDSKMYYPQVPFLKGVAFESRISILRLTRQF